MMRQTASARRRATFPTRSRATAPAPSRGADLARAVDLWLADGEAQGNSERTQYDRRKTMGRVAWWLENEAELPAALGSLTPESVRSFLSYCRREQDGGRWGDSHPMSRRKMRPASVNAYFRILRAFLNWCGREGLMRDRPLTNIKAPKIPADQIQPFSAAELQQLLDGARRRHAPLRDAAIVWVLADTGLRVSELISLKIKDLYGEELRVVGKGNKERVVFLGLRARKEVQRYLERDREGHQPDEPLFTAARANEALTGSGVYKAVAKAGKAGGVLGARCSPHTLRHTFAINFLRGGGSLLELKELLGHEDMAMLQRYVALAEVDLQQAHRRASPTDKLGIR